MPDIRIGCSGWNYPDWGGRFYPAGLPRKDWLRLYASVFDTVELNYSFYHLPLEATLRRWREEAGAGLAWSVKASRFITHVKRLRDAAGPVRTFLERLSLVSPRGPVLFQLPPSLKSDPGLLASFLDFLPAGRRYAMEFRHASWLARPCLDQLRRAGVAFCVSDTAGRYPCREELTADFAYVRLHGHERLYESPYTRSQLKAWARKVRRWDVDAFVYFDNTIGANAAANAREMKELLA